MASLDTLQTRNLAAKGSIGQVKTDTPVAIRLRYIGTGTVTSVTVTTATNIVMVTSDGGTDTYTFAAYTTVGALVDAINADGIFEAKVLDSLRSYATASQFVTGAITSTSFLDGAGTSTTVWDVKVDTSAAFYFAYRLTYDRGFLKGHKKNHRVILQQIKYAINMGTAAADSVQVWEIDGTVESQKLGYLSVDTTATTINWASGEGELAANDGNDLVILVKDAAALADVNTNYLEITGKIQ